MSDRQKSVLFTFLAASSAALSAVFTAYRTISHIFIVLPLVIMGIFLFFAGYYAGKASKK